MGLILEGDDYVILSDILGDEDALGDMDFKVAGTKNGITALQMDIKIEGINRDIVAKAINQANKGRLHILNEMAKTLDKSRDEINSNAPTIKTIKISKNKIGELIGPGGKNIKAICEKTGAKIDIAEDGTVNIAATDGDMLKEALAMVELTSFEPELNQIYEGKVVKLLDFGAFVNFRGRDGLVHISEIASERVENINDVLKIDDLVKVKFIGIDNKGRVKLSIKQVLIGDSDESASASKAKIAADDKPKQSKKKKESQQQSKDSSKSKVERKKYVL